MTGLRALLSAATMRGMQRLIRVGSVIVVTACGPGTGGSSGDSTGMSSTSGVTGTSSTSSGETGGVPTSGAPTSESGTTALDTGASTGDTAGTTEDPSGTTGSELCDAIVGSRDCAALVGISGDLTLEECMLCQGAPCGQEASCDSQYPCVDGAIVIQGCCTDEQCAGLTPFCGMFIGTNNVCVLSDDV